MWKPRPRQYWSGYLLCPCFRKRAPGKSTSGKRGVGRKPLSPVCRNPHRRPAVAHVESVGAKWKARFQP